MDTPIKIFSGRATLPLAKEIAKSYGVALGNIIISKFSDGSLFHLLKKQLEAQKSLLFSLHLRHQII